MMKARIFVLGVQQDEKNKWFDFMLSNTFAPVFTEEGALAYYDTVKDAIPSIGKAFADSDTVMFFAGKESFPQVKLVLSKALGLQMKIDQSLLETASLADPEGAGQEDFAVRSAGIPEGGVAFGLSDALDTGFGVHKGRQTIVVLPVLLDRTGQVLAQQVIPFINDLYGVTLPTFYADCIFAFALQEKLAGKELTVAMCDTPTTALFKQYLSHTPALDRRMPVAVRGEKREETPPDEYVVNLSITAAEFVGAPYGIAMTNAFYTGDDPQGERVVYLSVTSETENTIREVTSLYGETTPDLMNRCCGELCSLIGQIIDIDEGVLQKEPAEKEEKKRGKGKFIALLLLLLAAIAAVCVYGYYFFSQHDYNVRDWLNSYFPSIVRQADETTDDDNGTTLTEADSAQN
ncbi:MAG: hypothetical protein IJT27_06900 [Clostridia bacterium]|nr:hypothetical protein [Clostridia bacterium]